MERARRKAPEPALFPVGFLSKIPVQMVKQQPNLCGLIAPRWKQGKHTVGFGRKVWQQRDQCAFFNVFMDEESGHQTNAGSPQKTLADRQATVRSIVTADQHLLTTELPDPWSVVEAERQTVVLGQIRRGFNLWHTLQIPR